MLEREPPRFLDALKALADAEVEFLVVGGVAAVLAGAPVSTFDLDILYRRTPENVERLVGALRKMTAVYRDPAGRRIEPNAETLASFRMNLLRTRHGDVDVMAEIGDRRTYEDCLARSHREDLGVLQIRVLDLEAVIESKEFSNRPKDLAVLDVLRETLRMRGD